MNTRGYGVSGGGAFFGAMSGADIKPLQAKTRTLICHKSYLFRIVRFFEYVVDLVLMEIVDDHFWVVQNVAISLYRQRTNCNTRAVAANRFSFVARCSEPHHRNRLINIAMVYFLVGLTTQPAR